MSPEDDGLGTGLPEETLAPESTQGQEAAPVPGDVDYVEIKNRDEVWDVDRASFEAVARSMGKDVDQLRTALQMGLDGNRLYERVNDERDQLRTARQELENIRAEMMRAPATRQGPEYSPTQPMNRPPAQDVTGNVLWMADRLERLGGLIERMPVIEEALERTHQRVQDQEEAHMVAEERGYALQAYQDVSESWKKAGYGEAPSLEKLQNYLRRIPLSDDVDASWPEIWQAAAWAVAGPDVVRRQRRQQVIDSQKPGARIITAANQAPTGSGRTAPAVSASGDMSEDDMKAAEAALSGMTLAQVVGENRRMGS